MSYIREAFDQVCTERVKAEGAYVVLMEKSSFYGGPEEGGWWGSDRLVVEYQYFATREAAEAVQAKVLKLAEELNKDARRAEGEHCLRTMEWLEARGLDADYLPEPDGPSEYYVIVTDEVPENRYGSRHYE